MRSLPVPPLGGTILKRVGPSSYVAPAQTAEEEQPEPTRVSLNTTKTP